MMKLNTRDRILLSFVLALFVSAVGMAYVTKLRNQQPIEPFDTCYNGHMYHVDENRVMWPKRPAQAKDESFGPVMTCNN